MSKIYIKDIKKMCSCIAGLSCQTIRTNEKGAFNKGYICIYYISLWQLYYISIH